MQLQGCGVGVEQQIHAECTAALFYGALAKASLLNTFSYLILIVIVCRKQYGPCTKMRKAEVQIRGIPHQECIEN
jgi:hypothetical protein